MTYFGKMSGSFEANFYCPYKLQALQTNTALLKVCANAWIPSDLWRRSREFLFAHIRWKCYHLSKLIERDTSSRLAWAVLSFELENTVTVFLWLMYSRYEWCPVRRQLDFRPMLKSKDWICTISCFFLLCFTAILGFKSRNVLGLKLEWNAWLTMLWIYFSWKLQILCTMHNWILGIWV